MKKSPKKIKKTMNLKDILEKQKKEFEEKFYQDLTGEKVEGWLAMKTGKMIQGDSRNFSKIAIINDVESFLATSIRSAVEHAFDTTRVGDLKYQDSKEGCGCRQCSEIEIWNAANRCHKENEEQFLK